MSVCVGVTVVGCCFPHVSLSAVKRTSSGVSDPFRRLPSNVKDTVARSTVCFFVGEEEEKGVGVGGET